MARWFIAMIIMTTITNSDAAHGSALLTDEQMRVLRAVVDRIIPADEYGPSASEAGLIPFLLRQLETSLADRLPEYRAGLTALDAELRLAHGGLSLSDLAPIAQDALLTEISAGRTHADWGALSPAAFFRELVEHTQEGFYASPHGWKLVGFTEDATPEESAAGIASGASEAKP